MSGAARARAGLQAAAANVRVNGAGLLDEAAARAWLQELGELEAQADSSMDRVRAASSSRVSNSS